MAQDVIKLSPDALGYKDRGKMKWMGMMLSDHAEALKQQKKATQSAIIMPKEKLSLEEISTFLYKSYTLKKPLAIQLDIIKDGSYLSDIEGLAKGFREDEVYIKLRNHQLKQIRLEDIRHIHWIDSTQWFEKYQRQSIST
ncbi:MAG: hypothetical protein JJU16_07845 [Alkalibacterium sp.]|nr:hypothetical protein [Alkalibacterium sp.]